MWDDNELCEPDVARARGYPCCGGTWDGGLECGHALMHQPALPRWTRGELLIDIPGRTDLAEDTTWLFSVHGVLQRTQPAPLRGSRDAWINRVDGVGVSFTIGDDLVEGDDRDALVRDYLLARSEGDVDRWVRAICFTVRRPDPLFRLPERGRQLWFDARWPLPDGSRPLRVLTSSRTGAGWTDLSPAHGLLSHVNALNSEVSLIAALRDSARPDRWGAVAITRGGGGTPGRPGEWLEIFNSQAVIAAIQAVQALGVCVLAAVGHEADRTAVEAAADFSWATPSLLGLTLAQWNEYLLAELKSPDDGLEWGVYSAGRSVRQSFDEAWLHSRSDQEAARLLLPNRAWHST